MKTENDNRKNDIESIQEKQFMLKIAEVLAEEKLISSVEKARVFQRIREDDIQ